MLRFCRYSTAAVRIPSVNAPNAAAALPNIGMPDPIRMPDTLSEAAAIAERMTRWAVESLVTFLSFVVLFYGVPRLCC